MFEELPFRMVLQEDTERTIADDGEQNMQPYKKMCPSTSTIPSHQIYRYIIKYSAYIYMYIYIYI